MNTHGEALPPRHVSPAWGVLLLAACMLPGVLMLLGVEFGSQAPARTVGAAAQSETEAAFALLRGSFTHTILEWTSFCAASVVCILALVRYRLSRDAFMPIVVVALACAGGMDAFHTLAADRLIDAVADNRELIPFTWAICRMFTAVLVLIGAAYLLFSIREGQKTADFGKSATLVSLLLIVASSSLIVYCAHSPNLPQTMFPDALIKRPYDLAPLLVFAGCTCVLLPTYLQRRDSVFAQLLFLSLIPQLATQVYMTFGSSALFDGAFNIAHGLKALAYVVPAFGLVVDHIWTAERAASLATDLQLAKYRAEAFMDAASEGIVVIDPTGLIEACNPATHEMFGYEEDELLGQNVSIIAGGPHGVAHDDYLRKFLATGESKLFGKPREVLGRRQDGTEFPLRLSVSPAGLHGELFFIGMLDDLTAEKELQSQLQQAQKLESIGQLAAGIAHEINTPTQYTTDNVRFLSDASANLLAVLSAAGDIVEAQAQTSGEPSAELVALKQKLEQADVEFLLDEIPKAIEQSLDGLSSVAGIVLAMKEFSHPGQTEKTEVDLGRNIDTSVTVARNTWKYVAELEVDTEACLPLVPCLAGEFNQVILNLLVNAAQSIAARNEAESREKGLISIRTVLVDGWIEVRVKDNGEGIPADLCRRVFDPFFTTKDVGQGTGQGLAIARSVIVDKHGGTLRVESEVGVGAEFILRLPLAPETNAASEA